MSDTMLFGVLRMPYGMAMSSELSRRQFYDRAQEALDRIERLSAEFDVEYERGRKAGITQCYDECLTLTAERDALKVALRSLVEAIGNKHYGRMPMTVQMAFDEAYDAMKEQP